MNQRSVGIIGAGIAGLTAARLLRQAGYKPVVFDKGRAPGGRVATRFSREGHVFDHGAQYISHTSPVFQSVLNGAVSTGSLAEWRVAPKVTRYVGVPAMVDFPRHMARAVDLHLNTEVLSMRQDRLGWHLQLAEEEVTFPRVVLTCPPVQTARLLGDHDLAAPVAEVEMLACLTIMAAFREGPKPPFVTQREPMNSLAWIAHEGAKPQRPPGQRFVGQASEAFSAAHLEAEKPEVAELLLPLLANAVGREVKDAVYVAGHRWRYARVDEPLGEPCLYDPSRTVFVGGDWCLGEKVEAAWESGVAIAEAIIGS